MPARMEAMASAQCSFSWVRRPAGKIPFFVLAAWGARVHGASGQMVAAHSMISALLAPLRTRRPATAALTSMGLTSMIGMGQDAKTPTAIPRPRAAVADMLPVGTSTNAKECPLQALCRASCKTRARSNSSLLLRTTRRLPAPSVWTSSRPRQSMTSRPGAPLISTVAMPMLAYAASMPIAVIFIAWPPG